MTGATSLTTDVLCPECGTINHGLVNPCWHCAAPMLAFNSGAASVLAALARRPRRLIVEAEGPGPRYDWSFEGDGPFHVASHDGRTATLTAHEGDGQWMIVAGTRRSLVTSPTSFVLGRSQFRIRQCVMAGDATAPSLGAVRTKAAVLRGRDVLSLGRRSDCDFVVGDENVAPRHCIFATASSAAWGAESAIFILAEQGDVFINGKPEIAHRLIAGDFIQTGRFGWIYDADEKLLRSAPRIAGADVIVDSVAVRGRLAPTSMTLSAGQLAAVRGPSGSGKSTLVSTLVGRIAPSAGTIEIRGDANQDEDVPPRVGYVPQAFLLLPQLTARQTVAYSVRFRSTSPLTPENQTQVVEQALENVDLPRSTWDRPLALGGRGLSGGERRRVQVAAEIVHSPALLILDEPASGLDQAREERLLRTLRNLARRGGTVVVVTHGGREQYFDSTVRLAAIKLGVEQTTNKPLASPEAHRQDVARTDAPDAYPPSRRERSESRKRPSSTGTRRRITTAIWRRQVASLIDRNFNVLRAEPVQRFWWPIVGLPTMFAATLGCAVQLVDKERLGYLAVLAAIWMGASLGHLAIAEERDLVEHERLTFLRPTAYIAAKYFMLGVAGLLQTLVFLAVGMSMRLGANAVAAKFPSTGAVGSDLAAAAAMLMANWAAIGMGLVISAAAGASPRRAAFVLPLAMLVQIVFSVEIAGCGKSDVVEAYRLYNWTDSPVPTASRFSYATLARWGDMSVRATYGFNRDQPGALDYFADGIVALAAWIGVFAFMTVALMALPGFRGRADAKK